MESPHLLVKSGYSASEWVMLSEIHYRKRAPSELATLMKVPRCTISMRLKKLSEAGLVRTEKGNVDKRSRVLSLTEKGLIALAHIEAKAEEVYHRTLKSLSKTELARGITLLTRYVECLYPKPAAQTEVRRLLGNELNAVRERAWVALRHSLPSRYYPAAGFFFHEENINLYLKDQNLAEVALELTAESRKEVRLVNFVTLTDVNFSGSYATLKELVQKVVGKQLTIDAAFAQSICLEGLR
jgi:DNA-binding MarR family transcriptional regulator